MKKGKAGLGIKIGVFFIVWLYSIIAVSFFLWLGTLVFAGLKYSFLFVSIISVFFAVAFIVMKERQRDKLGIR